MCISEDIAIVENQKLINSCLKCRVKEFHLVTARFHTAAAVIILAEMQQKHPHKKDG